MVNDRRFQQVEVWILDLVIRILSQIRSDCAAFQRIFWIKQFKPLMFSAIIIGSSGIGLVSGYLFYVLTYPVR